MPTLVLIYYESIRTEMGSVKCVANKMVSLRSVFRTQLNIYDGAFQQKYFHKKGIS